MTYYLAELYSPKSSWHALDAEGRQAFLRKSARVWAVLRRSVSRLWH